MRTYKYWIGAKNDGGGLDSTGETGEREGESAQAVADEIALDYPLPGHSVCVRNDDYSETADADTR